MKQTTTTLLAGLMGGVALGPPALSQTASPFTVSDARTLPVGELATRILGPMIADRVIEARRREYTESDSDSVPRDVVFYTQPALTYPRVNGICGTDVITVEYDWFEHDHATPPTKLKINHVEATSRFKAFPMPLGEPGSAENDRLQAAECAKFTTALDSFAAPSAGDAQWLAAMEREYSRDYPQVLPFNFACEDFADATCAKARRALPRLSLQAAQQVESVDCPQLKSRDQVRYCYRLTFPYKGTDNPEWQMTLVGGMTDGSAPVQIRAAKLEHIRQPFVMSLAPPPK